MTSTAPSSQNSWTVTDATGTAIGSVTASMLGFVAWTAAGRSLGGFTTMSAAVAAIESMVSK